MPGKRLSEMGRQGQLQPPAHTLTPTRRISYRGSCQRVPPASRARSSRRAQWNLLERPRPSASGPVSALVHPSDKVATACLVLC